jgi:uncharacterized protein YbjT (DUF2867 family)
MEQTVLVLGGTGRTGGRVLQQMLDRGFQVRAIVRSTRRLPAGVVAAPWLTVVEAEPLALSHEALQRHLHACRRATIHRVQDVGAEMSHWSSYV